MPAVEGDPNCVLDLGTFSASEVGFDAEANLPLALGDQNIVVTNNGSRVLFLGAVAKADRVQRIDVRVCVHAATTRTDPAAVSCITGLGDLRVAVAYLLADLVGFKFGHV